MNPPISKLPQDPAEIQALSTLAILDGPIPAQMALDAAMDSVWKHKSALPNRGKQQQAVFVLEAIAVELARRFAIVTIDKRQSERRFHEIHQG